MDEGAGVRCGLSESAAESLLHDAAKAIEIEDIQARVAELERAAEAQQKH
jgi:hypothetical protein